MGINFNKLIASKGSAWKDSQIKSHSYYNDPISGDGPRGNSRIWGDADPEVQAAVIEAIIASGEAHGVTGDQIVLTIAIARQRKERTNDLEFKVVDAATDPSDLIRLTRAALKETRFGNIEYSEERARKLFADVVIDLGGISSLLDQEWRV